MGDVARRCLVKVLVTGSDGYIGAVLVPMLLEAGHDVAGLDSGLFADCTFGSGSAGQPSVPRFHPEVRDVRDVGVEDLRGFDAVCHLAAISNDPLGDLNPACTYDINEAASVRLAALAKDAGVQRFVFSSSCSLYGAAGDDLIDEHASFNPVTPYGASKVGAERGIGSLADAEFSPTFLRNATAYGASPKLRGDLVVNNLCGYAFTTGEVRMKSDGTPWRPLVHVADISEAFRAVLDAPRDAVHGEAFNVGRNEDNLQVRDVAALVEQAVPGSVITFAAEAGPDKRNYRVDSSKIKALVPGFRPRWTVRTGIEELVEAYRSEGLTLEDLTGPRLQRIARIRELQDQGRLDETLRWRSGAPGALGSPEETGRLESATPEGLALGSVRA